LSSADYTKDLLWPILIETVHSMVLYPHHKAYVSRVLLLERPDITSRDLSIFLGISLGEAMVLLHELKEENMRSKPEKNK
jgi:hypothetical protein